MDALLLVILIFAILVMLGISIYLLVRFVHRNCPLTQPTKRALVLPFTARSWSFWE